MFVKGSKIVTMVMMLMPMVVPRAVGSLCAVMASIAKTYSLERMGMKPAMTAMTPIATIVHKAV